MALQTATIKNALASAYGATAVSVALFTTAPGATAGTEVTGTGYARQTPSWGAPVAGVVTATITFTVPAGVTVKGAGLFNSAGTYVDGGAVTDQPFPTGGTYQLTVSETLS
jgi:hypothetical protein